MGAVNVGADVVESHLVLGSSRIGLGENGFSVFALWTGVILGPGEGRVSNDVSHDLGQLVDFVHDLVDVDAAAVSQLKETAKS